MSHLKAATQRHYVSIYIMVVIERVKTRGNPNERCLVSAATWRLGPARQSGAFGYVLIMMLTWMTMSVGTMWAECGQSVTIMHWINRARWMGFNIVKLLLGSVSMTSKMTTIMKMNVKLLFNKGRW
ncbi:hypothetical protein PV325_013127 [Microctonus aethiopoides]|nr:hypothetical protein PV325_013127 [Microctonus aethiopoides]KAK0098344.1 hypothetical protein PV326_009397 [Microctonus aethiopoides]